MSMLNLEAILGESMAAVEAAPDYVQLETGVYVLEVVDTGIKKQKRDMSKEQNKDKDPEFVQLSHTYKVVEVVQTDGSVLPVAVGSLTTDTWMYGEAGLPHFKARTIAIAEAAGTPKEEVENLALGEMLEGVKGLKFKVAVAKTARSDDPTRFNTRFSNFTPVGE